MGAGLSGTNGLNPLITRKMILLYVVPRILYGLETKVLVVYLFMGVLPLEAILLNHVHVQFTPEDRQ